VATAPAITAQTHEADAWFGPDKDPAYFQQRCRRRLSRNRSPEERLRYVVDVRIEEILFVFDCWH
jgi:hypothetical protein